MGIHLAAFAENVDQTLAPITPIADDQVTTSGDDLTIPAGLNKIVAALFGAPTIDSARIVAPSLYAQFTGGGPDFSPLNVGAEPVSPLPLHDLRAHPLSLLAQERLNVQIANSAAASGEDAWAGVWLANEAVQPAAGAWRTYKFTTAASALTAETWNTRALTAVQTLPPINFKCGGGFAVSTSGRLARLIFQGQANRPGFVMGDSESDVLARSVFRNGGMGVLGTFAHDTLPQIQIFADAADNEIQEVYLDLMPA